MSFDTYMGFDPALDLMTHGQHNGIPSMLACFDFKPVDAIPRGRDCVVVIGTRNHRAIMRDIAERARRAVVIVCLGDKTFRNSGEPIPNNVVRVFTTNRSHTDPRVTGVPIGVKSSTLQMLRFVRRHRPAGDHRDRRTLYLNFAIGNDYDLPAEQRGLPHRREIAERFRGQEWVTDRVFSQAVHREGVLFNYLSEVMRHKFVVSPEGFGIDCHRHWESLYLGAIPIVQRSEHVQTFSDLPILFTDDYSEITESYLRDAYEYFSERSFDFSKLYAPYYTGQLVDAVNGLQDPEFLLLLSDERSSKDHAADRPGVWPALMFLNRLSRYDDPYHADFQTGDLIPDNDYEREAWRALNGARISFGPNGALVVEHPSDTALAGASLDLRTVKLVTYRVHGEMHCLAESSDPPQVQVLSPQTKERVIKHKVSGKRSAPGSSTKVDFTFTSAKSGTSLQFWPGRRAMLDVKIEPFIA